MTSQNYIPLTELPHLLAIQPGDALLIASDLTRLAILALRKGQAFTPDLLIDRFLDKIGPEGTLILPAFNFNLRNGDTFDPLHTVPVTGALAEAAFKRKDFLRTCHPLHSFLVAGKDARLLAAMNNTSSFGPDSPFSYFKENNVKMVMIGTNVTDSFTFVHHVEELERVKYRSYRTLSIHYAGPDRNPEAKDFSIYAKKAGWTLNLSLLEALFREKDLLKQCNFNGIPCSQIRLGEAFPVIRDDIRSNHAGNISRFSVKLLLKEKMKRVLSSLHLHQTLTERIHRAAGVR